VETKNEFCAPWFVRVWVRAARRLATRRHAVSLLLARGRRFWPLTHVASLFVDARAAFFSLPRTHTPQLFANGERVRERLLSARNKSQHAALGGSIWGNIVDVRSPSVCMCVLLSALGAKMRPPRALHLCWSRYLPGWRGCARFIHGCSPRPFVARPHVTRHVLSSYL
jgi:hypothetical protein